MKSPKANAGRWYQLTLWLIMLLLSIMLTACGKTDVLTSTAIAATATTAWASPSATANPSPTPTLDLSRHYGGWPPHELAYDPTVQAIATAARRLAEADMTAIALTPTQPPQPTSTVAPTPTLGVGVISDDGCIYPPSHAQPMFPSCWHTIVNGNWFFVAAGHEGDERLSTLHGLFWVCPEPCQGGYPLLDQLYPAPRPDLHITAVDGARITLASRDPAVHDPFVFDIATFQWITPAFTPAPTRPPDP